MPWNQVAVRPKRTKSLAFSAFLAASAFFFSSFSALALFPFAPSSHSEAFSFSFSNSAASFFFASFSAFFARPDSFFVLVSLGGIVGFSSEIVQEEVMTAMTAPEPRSRAL
jgi:hypothetical protein